MANNPESSSRINNSSSQAMHAQPPTIIADLHVHLSTAGSTDFYVQQFEMLVHGKHAAVKRQHLKCNWSKPTWEALQCILQQAAPLPEASDRAHWVEEWQAKEDPDSKHLQFDKNTIWQKLVHATDSVANLRTLLELPIPVLSPAVPLADGANTSVLPYRQQLEVLARADNMYFRDYLEFNSYSKLRHWIMKQRKSINPSCRPWYELLMHVGARMKDAQVTYLEASLAGSQLIQHAKELYDGCEAVRKQYDVHFRFLAAFRRANIAKFAAKLNSLSVKDFLKLDSVLASCEKSEVDAVQAVATAKGIGHFFSNGEWQHVAEYLKQMHTTAGALHNAWNSNDLGPYVRHITVGLDIHGSELDAPFAFFHWTHYRELLVSMQQHNSNTGVRIHALETSWPLHFDCSNILHRWCEKLLHSTLNCIRALTVSHSSHGKQKSSSLNDLPVRIGHAIGWQAALVHAAHRVEEAFQTLFPHLQPVSAVTEIRQYLVDMPKFFIECCPVSNHLLLLNVTGTADPQTPRTPLDIHSHAVKGQINAGWKVVLGSDDPAFFPSQLLQPQLQSLLQRTPLPIAYRHTVQADIALCQTAHVGLPASAVAGILANNYLAAFCSDELKATLLATHQSKSKRSSVRFPIIALAITAVATVVVGAVIILAHTNFGRSMSMQISG